MLQGGGSLGAYECSVFQTLSSWLRQHDYSKNSNDDKPKEEKPLFDVIAGTSIGAINAAVLVGHFLKNNRSWNKSEETLEMFWEGLKSDAIVDWNPSFYPYWQYLHSIDREFAAPEVARRFWSIPICIHTIRWRSEYVYINTTPKLQVSQSV